MPVLVAPEHLAQLAPSARSSYRAAFAASAEVLDRYEISRTPARIAHFMAQVLHESGALTIQFENLNYSPARLPKVWPSRFQPLGALDPAAFAHAPEKLANEVYGGRMGNVNAGDGWRFRGRGLMQLTGRESYAKATRLLRHGYPEAPDFAQDPDAVIGSEWCLRIAAAEWFELGCNPLADADQLRAITRRINGGLIGLAERTEWKRRTSALWS